MTFRFQTMTALILYDNFTLAAKANALLQRASANASHFLDWHVIAWRTELLKSESMAEIALKEAVDAHLIICAWRDSRPFHLWTEKWLEEWISRRNIEEAAFALVGESEDPWTGAALELSQFAEKHRIALIVGRKKAARDETAPLRAGRWPESAGATLRAATSA
jgi:hypothetical protein